jgi:hypothetical protein
MKQKIKKLLLSEFSGVASYQVIGAVSIFLIPIIMIKNVGLNDYAPYALFILYTSALCGIADFGFLNGIQKLKFEKKINNKIFTVMYIIILMLIYIITYLMLNILVYINNHFQLINYDFNDLKTLFILAGSNIYSSFITYFSRNFNSFNKGAILIFSIRVLNLAIVLIIQGTDIRIQFLILQIINTIILIFYLVIKLKKYRYKIQIRELVNKFKLNKNIYNNFIQKGQELLQNRLEVLIIPFILTSSEVSILFILLNIFSVTNLLNQTFNNLNFARIKSQNFARINLYSLITLIILTLIISTGMYSLRFSGTTFILLLYSGIYTYFASINQRNSVILSLAGLPSIFNSINFVFISSRFFSVILNQESPIYAFLLLVLLGALQSYAIATVRYKYEFKNRLINSR